MDNLIQRLDKLLSVKSLVTLALTAVFAVLALRGNVSQDFMTIYAVIIAFYFGTKTASATTSTETTTNDTTSGGDGA
jgi:galactitol-specific phosphotransferase system IIC component